MSTVARRYAKALFGLAHDAGVLEPTMEQLNHMAAIANDPAVAPVLRNPLLSADRRAAVAALMAREVAASDLLTRFARLLADHQRLAELPAIAAEVQRMLDDALDDALASRGQRESEAQEQRQHAHDRRGGQQ